MQPARQFGLTVITILWFMCEMFFFFIAAKRLLPSSKKRICSSPKRRNQSWDQPATCSTGPSTFSPDVNDQHLRLTTRFRVMSNIRRCNLSKWPTWCTNSCFIMSLLYNYTCFEHNCAHHQEVKIVSHSIWHHHTLQAVVLCTGWERTESSPNMCIHVKHVGSHRDPTCFTCFTWIYCM